MKKTLRRTLSAMLTAVMILTAIPFSGIDLFTAKASAKDLSSYSVGDIITFGSYPQSKVTDNATISALNNINKTWISYGYYSGTGFWTDGEYANGSMKPSDYMKYCDISYNGNKYRAVTFSSYRPGLTGYVLYNNADTTFQDDNGYYTDNVYYFKYEPLTWRVLDPAEGFVMSTIAVDSQAYNNYALYYNNRNTDYHDDHYGDSAKSHYASDWASSSIRAWLNDDFYNTAFTSSEKSQIGTTYNENKSIYNSKYDSANTSDKIFLLSYDEVLNNKYGFSSSNTDYDTARQIKPTDYAQCQGCCKTYTDDDSVVSWWRLRSPASSYDAAGVYGIGDAFSYDYNVILTGGGIVPAFKFNPKSTIQSISAPTVTGSNVASSGKINLTWNAVDGAKEYKIYRATSKSGTYKLMKTTSSTSYVNTSAVAGTTYYYKVKAVAADGTSSKYSSVVTRTCDLPRPVVTASNVSSSGKVKLTWDAIDGAKEYKIYRATSKSGTYKLMKTTTSTSYTNSSATAGKTYYYKVKAVCSNSAADSAYSSIITRTCDLAKPANVQFYFNSSNKPVVKWSKVDGATSYKVYRATSQNGTYKLMKTTTSTSYTNTSFTHGTTYYYKVKAICSNSAADSAYSAVVGGYVK